MRRRAYAELEQALELAGPELSIDWVLNGDRDLQCLRELNEPEWQRFVRLHTPEDTLESLEFPEPARGDPHHRANLGLLFTVLFALACVPIVLTDAVAWWLAVVPAVLALWLAMITVKARAEARSADERSIRARHEAARSDRSRKRLQE